MAKPHIIYLVRHGQSIGNVDQNNYLFTPDHAIPLTDLGKQQLSDAGDTIASEVGIHPVYFWHSPYLRTRQSCEILVSRFPANHLMTIQEDSRLREMSYHSVDIAEQYLKMQRKDPEWVNINQHGHYFFKSGSGDSCADIEDRQLSFKETLYRYFESPAHPPYLVIVGHGIQLRLFLKAWLGWSVAEFENVRNPRNGEVLRLIKHTRKTHYELDVDLAA